MSFHQGLFDLEDSAGGVAVVDVFGGDGGDDEMTDAVVVEMFESRKDGDETRHGNVDLVVPRSLVVYFHHPM
jgi:hypothetical protein